MEIFSSSQTNTRTRPSRRRGYDVCAVVLKLLKGEGMDYILNQNFIALIPKVQHPTFVSDFRPINLCNVLYKLVSKVIVNRLKPIMSSIISCNQSAFLTSRLIFDNILTAY